MRFCWFAGGSFLFSAHGDSGPLLGVRVLHAFGRLAHGQAKARFLRRPTRISVKRFRLLATRPDQT